MLASLRLFPDRESKEEPARQLEHEQLDSSDSLEDFRSFSVDGQFERMLVRLALLPQESQEATEIMSKSSSLTIGSLLVAEVVTLVGTLERRDSLLRRACLRLLYWRLRLLFMF